MSRDSFGYGKCFISRQIHHNVKCQPFRLQGGWRSSKVTPLGVDPQCGYRLHLKQALRGTHAIELLSHYSPPVDPISGPLRSPPL